MKVSFSFSNCIAKLVDCICLSARWFSMFRFTFYLSTLFLFACGEKPQTLSKKSSNEFPTTSTKSVTTSSVDNSNALTKADEATASSLPFGGSECRVSKHSLKTELRALNMQVATSGFLSEKNDVLTAKINRLKTLKAQNRHMVLFFHELAKSTPSNLRLEHLRKNDGQVILSGVAASSPGISQFMADLESSDLFTALALRSNEKKQHNDTNMQSFSISAMVSPLSLLALKPLESDHEQLASKESSSFKGVPSDSLAKQCPELSDLLAEVELRREQLASIAKNEKRWRDMQLELDQLLMSLPRTFELPGLIKSISDKALNAGLEIKRFVALNEYTHTSNEFVSQIPISVVTSGGFHQLSLFFESIAKMDRMVHAKDLSLEMKSESGSEQLIATFQLVSYRFLSDHERDSIKRTHASANSGENRGQTIVSSRRDRFKATAAGVWSDAWRDFTYNPIGKRDPFKRNLILEK